MSLWRGIVKACSKKTPFCSLFRTGAISEGWKTAAITLKKLKRTYLNNNPQTRSLEKSIISRLADESVPTGTLRRYNAEIIDFPKNPKGYDQYSRYLCRSSSVYRRGYTFLVASRSREYWSISR